MQRLLRGRGARLGIGGAVVIAIILTALAFIVASILLNRGPDHVDTAAGRQFPCTVLSVYDGDGPINCEEIDTANQQVRVRLRGIDARENDNSCQYAGHCAEASGAEAKAELIRMAVGKLQCTSFGPSYNRVDASCVTATGLNLSCEMIRRGKAVRWPQYDPDGRLAACVPRR